MNDTRFRLALLFGLMTAAGLGVGCDGATDGAGEGEGETQQCAANSRPCDNDRLCGGGFCDYDGDGDGVSKDDGDDLGCCLRLVCIGDADCADTEKCDVRRGICVPEGLCDPAQERGGTCVIDGQERPCCDEGKLCSYSGGEPVCLDGPPAIATCFIAAGGRPVASQANDEVYPAVAKAGAPVQLEAFGADAQGRKVPHATFTWSGAGVDAATGVFNGTCEAGVCSASVTATSGSTSCTGQISVYAAPAEGTSRIVVIDLATGQPLEGVDAAANINGTVVSETTDATGAATFDGEANNISAFPPNHQWHSIIQPPADVIIYTAAVPDAGEVAGVKGKFNFDNVHTKGDIRLGLAGTAIASSITDLNFATLVGEIADYRVEVEDLTEEGGQLVPLPSGLVIGLGDTWVKEDFVAFGEPGKNIAWAIGGQVALTKVGTIISDVAASEETNIGAILSSVLPFFATFDHGIVSGLDLETRARPVAPADGSPVDYNAWTFDEVTLAPNTLLSQSVTYAMPDLPCAPGAVSGSECAVPADSELPSPYASGVVLLSGVVVPGVGLVPLGITAGLDDPDEQDGIDTIDGKLTGKGANAPEDGEVIVDYAPPHDGLEGSLYVSVAIALDINALEDSSSFGASIITHVAKAFSPSGNTFKQEFLQSQQGTFTPGPTGTFQHQEVGAPADFYRVNFDNNNNAEWNVWFAAGDTLVSPAALHPAPAEAADRLQHADIQAFKLGTGYEELGGAVSPDSYEALFAFDGANLDNLLYYLGAWSSEACKEGGPCTEQQ